MPPLVNKYKLSFWKCLEILPHFLQKCSIIKFFSQEIVDEIDEDGSGELEFPEFIQLASKFLVEEDEEQMKWELREAFRIYDKQGK